MRMSHRSKRPSRTGGGAALLVVLLAILIVAIIYFGRFGKDGKSYVETLIDTKQAAKDTVTTGELSSLYKELLVYVMTNDDKFPPTKKDIMRESPIARKYLRDPDPNSRRPRFFYYIEGQDMSMPASNVLIWEERPGRDDACHVLRISGQVDFLPIDQIDLALDATEEAILRTARLPPQAH